MAATRGRSKARENLNSGKRKAAKNLDSKKLKVEARPKRTIAPTKFFIVEDQEDALLKLAIKQSLNEVKRNALTKQKEEVKPHKKPKHLKSAVSKEKKSKPMETQSEQLTTDEPKQKIKLDVKSKHVKNQNKLTRKLKEKLKSRSILSRQKDQQSNIKSRKHLVTKRSSKKTPPTATEKPHPSIDDFIEYVVQRNVLTRPDPKLEQMFKQNNENKTKEDNDNTIMEDDDL